MKRVLMISMTIVLIVGLLLTGIACNKEPTAGVTKVEIKHIHRLYDQEVGILVYYYHGGIDAVQVSDPLVSLKDLPKEKMIGDNIKRIIEEEENIVIYLYYYPALATPMYHLAIVKLR